jgi:hypothetical protein
MLYHYILLESNPWKLVTIFVVVNNKCISKCVTVLEMKGI